VNRALIYLLIATGLFSIINIGVKTLSYFPVTEILVFRAFISLLICSFFIWKKKGSFLGNNIKILFLRGLFGTIALLSFFICLQKIPLAVAMTLINLSPIFTVIISHIFLKEKAKPLQWIFLLLSFLGVYLVRGEIEPVPLMWMFLGIISALAAGSAYTCVRHLRLSEDPLVVIFYFPLITIPIIGPFMIFHWQTPSGFEWFILIGIGILTQGAQYYMTLAYQMETAANVMIFNYAGLFWGIILGWSLFNESLSRIQIIGVFVVFFCLCGNYFVSRIKGTHVYNK
jgi:drug/metabolite transporter (DMT)-like permease